MQYLRRTPLHPQWLIFSAEHRARDWVRKHAQGHVLDIGCADGWARMVVNNCAYVGLDYPTTAIAMYRTTPDVFADGHAIPFAGSSFDTVLLLEVLEHVRDPECVLREIARVLKPGGRLLLSVPFLYPLHDAPHDYQRYTEYGLQQIVGAAGLVTRELLPRVQGLESAALLTAIACAESVLHAARNQRWRLIFAPLFITAIPLVNTVSWLAARLAGRSQILAAGFAMIATKPK
ncbi:MAG: class I SAM-dependent methyltransferase [Gammaproteobacteria bacterium]